MRVRRLTATLALSALALSGCSGGGDGEETTSSTVKPTVIDPSGDSSSTSGSSSSSTSGSSTSSTSEADADGPPEEAKANTKEGAEAFAKWYWEENGEASHTGDGSPLREYATSGCDVCEALANGHEEKKEKDLLTKENPYRVAVTSSRAEAGQRFVTLDIEFDDYYYYDSEGIAKGRVKAQEFQAVLTTNWQSGGWRADNSVVVQ